MSDATQKSALARIGFKLAGSLVLLLSLSLGGLWKYLDTLLEVTPRIPEEGMVVEVRAGDNFYQFNRALAEEGLAPEPLWVKLIAWRNPELTRLQVAEYAIESGMSYGEILKRLTSGQGIQYNIRFIEGWNIHQAIEEIKKHNLIIKDIELTPEAISSYLSLPYSSAEGWLFPDTYQYHKDSQVTDLISQMYQRMQQSLELAWHQRSVELAVDNPYELLILASIIEKETALGSERTKIAGVFNRRLVKGMRLQTDPTVIYGLGEQFDGDIKRGDLKRLTPYNTYRIDGLPPTPIALPSEASLLAAANPQTGTELYFVAKGDGSHVFSDTLEQHNLAVRRYQLGK